MYPTVTISGSVSVEKVSVTVKVERPSPWSENEMVSSIES
jgi:hypothetical protein